MSIKGGDCSCVAGYKFGRRPDLVFSEEDAVREALKMIIAGPLVERGLDQWSELKLDDVHEKCGQSLEIQNLLDKRCPQDTWVKYVRETKELFVNPLALPAIKALVKELLVCKSVDGDKMERILRDIASSS